MRRSARRFSAIRAAIAASDPLFTSVKFGANFTGTNGQTSATDFSASARAITFVGNAQITTGDSTFGTGSSLVLDGNGDHLTIPDSADWAPGLNVDFCWEFVLKTNGNAVGNVDLLSQATGSGIYPIRIYRLANANGGIGLLSFNSSAGLDVNANGGTLTDNTWTHVVVCREGTTMRVYIGGVQAYTVTGVGAARTDAADTMKIGVYNPTNTQQWNGWIQDVRYTLGNARYPGGTTFTPPTTLFPTL